MDYRYSEQLTNPIIIGYKWLKLPLLFTFLGIQTSVVIMLWVAGNAMLYQTITIGALFGFTIGTMLAFVFNQAD